MKQTEHYGLNQWELADRIQMEDFNGDNEKVDAALAGLREEIAAVRGSVLCEKLVDYTTTAAAQQVDIDVSGIDFTQYVRIDLSINDTGNTGNLNLRVNHLTSYTDVNTVGSGSGLNASTDTVLARLWSENGCVSGILAFNPPQAKTYIHCYYSTGRATACSNVHRYAACKWKELRTLNLICPDSSSKIPAGSRVIITVIRK